MDTKTKRGYGKGWLLILYAFLGYFTATAVGSAMNAASGTLADLRGWNAAVLTSLISLGSIANIVAGFVLGKLSSKYSAKKLSLICFGIYVAVMLGLGATSNFMVFAICLILANGISSGIGYQLSPVLISRWFPKRKGMIMGLVTMGIPLCSGVATMIYQAGYGAMGSIGGFLPFIIIAVAAAIILIVFLSDNPADRGFAPDNGIKVEGAKEEAVNKDSIWTTSKLLRTPQVWVHGITLGTQLLFASGLMVQLFPRLLEIGFDEGTASMMMLASGLLALPGSYLCGVLDSKIGARKAAYSSFIFGILAMVLNLTGTTAGVWISLVCIGMVVGGAANWPASLCIEEFGDSFANGYGIIQPIIQVVGAIGPAFFAAFYGITGSYRIPYICGAVLMLVGLVCFKLFAKEGFVKAEEEKCAAK
ncbi:MFS transporter [Lachnospiraceae bacterium]|uniref:MFS transporter n=1 Tax=Lachnospiraceae TaxID=186803 RepID=UPI00082D9CCF|nr:MFS transporter [Extibacter sp. GGCC_0201]MBO1720790.1 MFS transporter [Extibacter sp. GGCC_0201]RGU95958.1 MFS transporter [Clostridium sp. AF15-17LB]BDF33339.1 MFS transporter [Lachnospiraceae bacterium]BDF37343.1 MFS transporter [Lachnospiraceae bacterium]